jgi:membrane fusion protein, hemolysin D
MNATAEALSADALDFAPDILRLQQEPPSPLPRAVLYVLGTLLLLLAVWSAVGRLNIIAVASGKLVPQSYVKVVQPASAGVIKAILVREGDSVKAGQVLARLDPGLSEVDSKQVGDQLQIARLAQRRIDAELAGVEPTVQPGDLPELFSQMLAQYRARRQAQVDAVDAQRAMLSKAEQDLQAAQEMQSKLKQTLPIYQDQESAWQKLQKEGFAGRLLAEERRRMRIEAQQEMKAQAHAIEGYRAAIMQSRKRMEQLDSNYRQALYNERVEMTAQAEKLEQDQRKQVLRRDLLELRAPQDGTVKDLATHTEGAVLTPGSVLLTLVPANEPLHAEVWVTNLDRGFVHPGQAVKVKVAPYPFQKYGMVEGVVKTVGADVTEQPANDPNDQKAAPNHRFRSLVELKSQYLDANGVQHRLTPGMQVDAEIKLGDRTVLEYVLSPVRKAFHEAAHER